MKKKQTAHSGPLHWEWALLFLAVGTAVLFRFYRLGEWPPGLYRDEAYNGLDALNVLQGQLSLFFPANNGREPAYIYLAATAVSLWGRTPWALRLGAAVVGSLTTLAVYALGRSWWGGRVGLLAAWLWAITLWPVHLSRIGLRIILLPLLLTITFWLLTWAYRGRQRRRWLLAGLAYGAAFYTYLAVRFTPVLLLALAGYVVWMRRERVRQCGAGMVWFGLGTAVTLFPLALVMVAHPDILTGRLGQVSILNTAVNGGHLWPTLGQQIGAAVGLFIWRGDTILRHNPAGRPLFDWLLAGPFLWGVGWCIWHWRRPAAAATLLWVGIMLGPTILAEDTPHFLRAAGILPAVIWLPAVGLDVIWRWLAAHVRPAVATGLMGVLVLGSAGVTMRDYVRYARDPETGYLFEQAAVDLAQGINAEAGETAVFVDERFWAGWPSLPFLVTRSNVTRFTPEGGLPTPLPIPAVVYAWPYGALDFLPAALPATAQVRVEPGSWARGDLETAAYALYSRYVVQAAEPVAPLANFGDELWLQTAVATTPTPMQLVITLTWGSETAVPQPRTVFVHVLALEGVLAQDDAPPAAGLWPAPWWRPGLTVTEVHLISLPQPFDPARHRLLVGVYDSVTQIRLPVLAETGKPVGDTWELRLKR